LRKMGGQQGRNRPRTGRIRQGFGKKDRNWEGQERKGRQAGKKHRKTREGPARTGKDQERTRNAQGRP
jgi:hypothetical protein